MRFRFCSVMRCVALLVALLFGESALVAQPLGVVPQPRQISLEGKAAFVLKPSTRVVAPAALSSVAERYAEELAELFHFKRPLSIEEQGRGILLQLDESLPQEGYALEIQERQITVRGASEAGLYYALQSLHQLLFAGAGSLACGTIQDAPNFLYRGAHLDVVRHFYTVEEVKRYIDILAAHKLNRLHWHLTDDQGWRIEIKRYPELTERSAARNETLIGHCLRSTVYDGVPYGPYYYTQEQIREVVAYAAERYITIIPEIEMPSHGQAALHALPWLGCQEQDVEVWTAWGVSPEVMCGGKETTYTFLEHVLEEVIALFPSEYIHIGGDECPKDRWRECPHCQARIRELGFIHQGGNRTPEEQLQSYLTQRIERFLAQHGRRIIGWDDMLAGGVSPSATVMSWQGTQGGIYAAQHGNQVVMAPMEYCYFDFYETRSREDEGLGIGGWIPFEKILGWDPYAGLNEEEQRYILGLQCNIWTEYLTTFEQVQRRLLPRLAALSEVQWATQWRDKASMRGRMEQLRRYYEARGWRYTPFYFERRE